jgi:hypothetical protein
LETKADLKDKTKPEELKKESSQNEISGSTTNEKVSNEYVPDVFILPNTQIPDE